MALKILGQLNPLPNVLSNLYTVPASKSASISSITCCNIGLVDDKITIVMSFNGESLDNKQYIYYNIDVPVNDTFVSTIGLTMSSGDILKVLSFNGNVSFNLFGNEV